MEDSDEEDWERDPNEQTWTGDYVRITWEYTSATMVRPYPCKRCNRMPDEGDHETTCGEELPVGCGDGGESDADMTDDGSEDPLSEPPTFDKLRLVDPLHPAWEPHCEPEQALFVRHVFKQLQDHPRAEQVRLTQTWGGFPPICTEYHEELDEEEYSTAVEWRVPLPTVRALHIVDVHPKLLYAFLTHFHLPKVNTLNLTYDIRGQPERRELLLVLINVGAGLLDRLWRIDSIRELHCHHIDVLERFYVAIKPVYEFTLHYWDGAFNCQEWLVVLQAQWDRVLGGSDELPYLPCVRFLTVHGLPAARLCALLDKRKVVGCPVPITGLNYQEGYILQHEHDRLENEMNLFGCAEEITSENDHFDILTGRLAPKPRSGFELEEEEEEEEEE